MSDEQKIKDIVNAPLVTGDKIYLIGIGGIGMSALARYFVSKGCMVSGYDKTETPLTKKLIKEGIAVHYDDNVDLIAKDAKMVVYTPAVPSDHKELQYYRDNHFAVVKRSEVLGGISNSSFNICVGGTHGKTTITTMIAHILRHTGYGCNAFLGGISVNYNTNFWSNERNVCVIEADEYDRSFLKLSPDIAIISSMDADHLDIYGTEEALQDAFVEFSSKVKVEGLLINKFGLKRGKDLKGDKHIVYSLQNESADVYAANITLMNGGYAFDIVMKDNIIENVLLNMGGMHNVENAIAAITVANKLGIDNKKIKEAIGEFKGIKRRFEYIIAPANKKEVQGKVVFVDDYAHHPEELKALLNGVKSLFRGKKCTIIFQPHLYSRTRDLANAFAEALDIADDIILLPIYPARELPIEGINSEMIITKMKSNNKTVMTKEAVYTYLKDKFVPGLNREFPEVLVTAGAGDIDTMLQSIKDILEKE